MLWIADFSVLSPNNKKCGLEKPHKHLVYKKTPLKSKRTGSDFNGAFRWWNNPNSKRTPHHCRVRSCVLWQGQKDSNSRHAVLETAALPAELYPCMVGLRGREPGTGRL